MCVFRLLLIKPYKYNFMEMLRIKLSTYSLFVYYTCRLQVCISIRYKERKC